MTSKLRFLNDGTGMVYVNTPFTLLSSPSFARRSTWKPGVGVTDCAFQPQCKTSGEPSGQPPTAEYQRSTTCENAIDVPTHDLVDFESADELGFRRLSSTSSHVEYWTRTSKAVT